MRKSLSFFFVLFVCFSCVDAQRTVLPRPSAALVVSSEVPIHISFVVTNTVQVPQVVVEANGIADVRSSGDDLVEILATKSFQTGDSSAGVLRPSVVTLFLLLGVATGWHRQCVIFLLVVACVMVQSQSSVATVTVMFPPQWQFDSILLSAPDGVFTDLQSVAALNSLSADQVDVNLDEGLIALSGLRLPCDIGLRASTVSLSGVSVGEHTLSVEGKRVVEMSTSSAFQGQFTLIGNFIDLQNEDGCNIGRVGDTTQGVCGNSQGQITARAPEIRLNANRAPALPSPSASPARSAATFPSQGIFFPSSSSSVSPSISSSTSVESSASASGSRSISASQGEVEATQSPSTSSSPSTRGSILPTSSIASISATLRVTESIHVSESSSMSPSRSLLGTTATTSPSSLVSLSATSSVAQATSSRVVSSNPLTVSASVSPSSSLLSSPSASMSTSVGSLTTPVSSESSSTTVSTTRSTNASPSPSLSTSSSSSTSESASSVSTTASASASVSLSPSSSALAGVSFSSSLSFSASTTSSPSGSPTASASSSPSASTTTSSSMSGSAGASSSISVPPSSSISETSSPSPSVSAAASPSVSCSATASTSGTSASTTDSSSVSSSASISTSPTASASRSVSFSASSSASRSPTSSASTTGSSSSSVSASASASISASSSGSVSLSSSASHSPSASASPSVSFSASSSTTSSPSSSASTTGSSSSSVSASASASISASSSSSVSVSSSASQSPSASASPSVSFSASSSTTSSPSSSASTTGSASSSVSASASVSISASSSSSVSTSPSASASPSVSFSASSSVSRSPSSSASSSSSVSASASASISASSSSSISRSGSPSSSVSYSSSSSTSRSSSVSPSVSMSASRSSIPDTVRLLNLTEYTSASASDYNATIDTTSVLEVVAQFSPLENVILGYQICYNDNSTVQIQDGSYNVILPSCLNTEPVAGSAEPDPSLRTIWHRVSIGTDYEISIPVGTADNVTIKFEVVSSQLGASCPDSIMYPDLQIDLYLVAALVTNEDFWFQTTVNANLETCSSTLSGAELTVGLDPADCGSVDQTVDTNCSNPQLPTIPDPSVYGTASNTYYIIKATAEDDGLLVIYSDACFPGHAIIMVFGRGLIRMDALRAGDLVMGEGGEWTAVVGWMHRDEQAEIEYVQVTHSSGQITLSPEHIIWVEDSQGDRQAIPAEEVKAGDKVIDEAGHTQQVISVERVTHGGGVYSPLTASGDIVVDGTLCSCFSAIELPAPFYRNTHAKGMMATIPQRWVPSVFGSLENPSKAEYSTWSLLEVARQIGALYSGLQRWMA